MQCSSMQGRKDNSSDIGGSYLPAVLVYRLFCVILLHGGIWSDPTSSASVSRMLHVCISLEARPTWWSFQTGQLEPHGVWSSCDTDHGYDCRCLLLKPTGPRSGDVSGEDGHVTPLASVPHHCTACMHGCACTPVRV